MTDTKPAAEFPQSEWPRIRELLETEGAAAVVAFVEGHADLLARRKLYLFATSAIDHREWDGKHLDALVHVGDAAVREGLRQAADELDGETAQRRTDFANVVAYNVSAALANCWPGDDRVRERRHFDAGLRLAEDCVRWRDELGKGPGPKSMATWAVGMHRLSQGDVEESREAFARSLVYARHAAGETAGDPVAAHADFSVALGEGYLGLAEEHCGDVSGRDRFDEALAAFARMAEDPDRKDDADFGVAQLEEARRRHTPSG